MVEGQFHIEGFPDASGCISISDLVPHQSRELANIASCRLDLVFAKACLDFLKTRKNLATLLQDALWRGAIVHYTKCFAQRGSRKPLPYTKILSIIPDSEAQPREIHKYFMGLRNKHIVHDDNAWLQVLTGAVIAAPGKGYNVEKVICTSFQGQTFNEGNFGNLYLLIQETLKWVETRFDTLCDDIGRELEKLPRERLLNESSLKFRAPEAKDVDSPRSHS
jgi:hypothetical protein